MRPQPLLSWFCTQKAMLFLFCVWMQCVTNGESQGWGIVSFCMPEGWGRDCPERKKWQIPEGTPGESVTGGIESYIRIFTSRLKCPLDRKWKGYSGERRKFTRVHQVIYKMATRAPQHSLKKFFFLTIGNSNNHHFFNTIFNWLWD